MEALEGLVWEHQEKWKERVAPCSPSVLVLESCCVVKEQAQTFQDIWNTKMAESEANKWFQKLGSHRSATSADRC